MPLHLDCDDGAPFSRLRNLDLIFFRESLKNISNKYTDITFWLISTKFFKIIKTTSDVYSSDKCKLMCSDLKDADELNLAQSQDNMLADIQLTMFAHSYFHVQIWMFI